MLIYLREKSNKAKKNNIKRPSTIRYSHLKSQKCNLSQRSRWKAMKASMREDQERLNKGPALQVWR